MTVMKMQDIEWTQQFARHEIAPRENLFD